MTLDAGARLGPYEIGSILGAGGMGEVYKAKDLRLDRLVAIKIIRGTFSEEDDRRQRFDQEARAVAQLNHPSVLVLHDFGIHEGAPYMVSEFLEGETLRALIAHGPLSPRRTVDIAREVAQGLAAAHEKGIVHRDLKPENILITKSGRAKILDFGIAKVAKKQAAAEDGPTAQILTEPGHIIGTVGYMSPEQVRGQEADSRSDIFAFGAIVHEMLSGKQSFVRNSAVESLNAILKDDPKELAELGIVAPQSLERAVRRCLEKEPTRRFQSAHDLAFALETMDTQPRRADAAPAESARPKARFPALVAVAALAAGLALGWGWPRKPIPAPRFEFHRLTFQRGFISGALFAPDGQTIVYDGSFEGTAGGVHTTRAGSHEFRSLDLPPGTQLLALSSTGELAIRLPSSAQGGVLARVPLAGGVPRPLVEGAGLADWSPDGKQLAIVRNVPGGTRLEYPIGTTLAQVSRPGRIGRLRVSPEGDRVAFVEHPPGANSPGHVTVVDRKGSKRVLSGEWVGMLAVAWSEDGNEVYFSGTNRRSVRDGGAGLAPPAIWAVDMAGKERLVLKAFAELTLRDARKGRLLVTETVAPRLELAFRSLPETTERDLAWLNWSVAVDLSPDGKLVLFDETRAGDGTEAVYLRKTDGTPPIRLGNGQALALSADGRWAATVETTSAPSPIVLMPTGAGEPRTLKHTGLIYLNARFFPDTKRLLVRANEPGRNPRLYVQGIDDGAIRPVTPEDVSGLALSADGARAATLGSDRRAMSYPTSGGDGTPLAGFEPGDEPIQWSADGQSLFAGRLAGQRYDIHRVGLESGKRELLRSYAAAAFQSFPLRALVTPDGKSSLVTVRNYWLDLYLVEGAR